MYLSKSFLDIYFLSKNISVIEYEQAFNKLGWAIVDKYDYSHNMGPLYIGKIGHVSDIENSKNKFVFIDLGAELVDPFVSDCENLNDGAFVLVGKENTKLPTGEIVREQIIDERASTGKILSLGDLGFKDNTVDLQKIAFNLQSRDYLGQYAGQPIGEQILGLNSVVWNVAIPHDRDDLMALINVVNLLALVLNDKQVISAQYKKPRVLANDHNINLKLRNAESKALQLFAYNFVEAKQIIALDESELDLKLYSREEIMLRQLNINISPNFFVNLSNIIKYETGVNVVFIDEKLANEGITVFATKDEFRVTTLGETLLFSSNEGYSVQNNQSYKTKNYVVLYYVLQNDAGEANDSVVLPVMKSSHKANAAYQRVIYWLEHYDILSGANELQLQLNTAAKLPILLSSANLYKEFGKAYKVSDLNKLFTDLGVEFTKQDNDFNVDVTDYRQDIKNEADLINEIRDLLHLQNKVD